MQIRLTFVGKGLKSLGTVGKLEIQSSINNLIHIETKLPAKFKINKLNSFKIVEIPCNNILKA